MIKINSKVRIKSKKWYENMKDKSGMIPSDKVMFGFNHSMASFCGKIATIIRIEVIFWNGKAVDYYVIDLDHHRWKWVDDMFDIKKGIEIE